MAKWRVLVADDEPAARRGVRQLLAAHSSFDVAAEARNGAEALDAIERLQPDVVFLDVQMPGLDGFGVIQQRGVERMPVLVFLTAYDEHALRAFDAQALDYLVKPVSEARFATTIRRLTRYLATGGREDHETIAVNTRRGTRLIRLRDIEWVESADNYAKIWIGDRSWLLRESLTALESRFQSSGFVRVHRQALVRVSAILALRRSDSASELVVELHSGTRIAVSRRRRASVQKVVNGRASRLTSRATDDTSAGGD